MRHTLRSFARPALGLAISFAALLATGCASSGLVGTWKSERAMLNQPASDFDFASVTFAPDGTYTAEMVYGGRTLAETGTWEHDEDELEIGPDPEREYGVSFDGPDTVTFDAGPKGAVKMLRYRP